MRRVYIAVAIAFIVSVVHYTDNYVNYDAYPQATSGPQPSATTIGLAWIVFTAFAIAAVVLLRRGRTVSGAVCLAIYSISGLIGIGHYTVPGATDMVWWRQAHVIADIVMGFVLLGLAVGLVRRRAPAN